MALWLDLLFDFADFDEYPFNDISSGVLWSSNLTARSTRSKSSGVPPTFPASDLGVVGGTTGSSHNMSCLRLMRSSRPQLPQRPQLLTRSSYRSASTTYPVVRCSQARSRQGVPCAQHAPVAPDQHSIAGARPARARSADVEWLLDLRVCGVSGSCVDCSAAL